MSRPVLVLMFVISMIGTAAVVGALLILSLLTLGMSASGALITMGGGSLAILALSLAGWAVGKNPGNTRNIVLVCCVLIWPLVTVPMWFIAAWIGVICLAGGFSAWILGWSIGRLSIFEPHGHSRQSHQTSSM